MAGRMLSPRVVVQMEDGRELDLQTTNPDLLRWDRTRVRHKWPSFDDAPFLWMTFIAWSAARRTGTVDKTTTWEVWEQQVVAVSTADDDDEDDDELTGRPTRSGAEPD